MRFIDSVHRSPTETDHSSRRLLLAPVLLAALTTSACAQESMHSHPSQPMTLPQAVELAIQHNRNLQMARLGVDDAEQKRRVARSYYFPQIKNESMARYVTEIEGVVIPAGAFANGTAGPVPTQTVRIGQGAHSAYTSGTGLAQPITQLLRAHAGVRAATADVKIAGLESEETENSIALLVHKLYFDILINDNKRVAAEESVKAGVVVSEESEKAVTEGRSLDLLALESRAALLEQKQASLTLELASADLMNQLDDVLGLPPGTPLALDPANLGAPATMPSEAEAIASAKAHNSAVLSARQTVEKAEAAVKAARSAYIPDVTGLARYSYQSGVPLLVHNFGSFGGAVSYDLFDGGAREARLKQARVELRVAVLRLAQTEADVSVQVSASYDEIRKLQRLIAVVAEGLTVRTEATRVSQQRFEQNAALASEVAKANASEASARASVLEATLDLALTQNHVSELLGQRPN